MAIKLSTIKKKSTISTGESSIYDTTTKSNPLAINNVLRMETSNVSLPVAGKVYVFLFQYSGNAQPPSTSLPIEPSVWRDADPYRSLIHPYSKFGGKYAIIEYEVTLAPVTVSLTMEKYDFIYITYATPEEVL